MNKVEFLKELEEQLREKVTKIELEEIISKYNQHFDSKIAQGKWESAIAVDLGAPGIVAKNILEEKFEQQKIKPDELCSMGTRVAAYFIDSVLLNVLLIIFLYLLEFILTFREGFFVSNPFENLSKLLPFMILIGAAGISNIIEAVILWKTNGYTPGKWFLKIRVKKVDRSALTFSDAFLREVVLKCLINTLTSGVLNLCSFLWACATEEKKTVHDKFASTTVVKVK